MKNTHRRSQTSKYFVIIAAAAACAGAACYFWAIPWMQRQGNAAEPIVSESVSESAPEPDGSEKLEPSSAPSDRPAEPSSMPSGSDAAEASLEPSGGGNVTDPAPGFSADDIPAAQTPPEPLIDYLEEGNRLELPVNGASGYASVRTELFESPDGKAAGTLEPGQGFTILEEAGDWWRILWSGQEGWIIHQSCMINLPDVVPSIIYNISNAYASKFKSSGVDLPGITGQPLFQAYGYNARLGEEAFTVPVLYSMAPKISAAQQAALADGNTLIIYEAFRPRSVQKKVSAALTALAEADPVVKKGVSSPPWSIRWFIADGTSSHQQGCAIDVSLGRISAQRRKTSGIYTYKTPDDYEEYIMPTVIHELSTASVTFKNPVKARVTDLWRSAEPADSMNSEALLLQKYCTDAGLTPLSSEWWHFDDVDSLGSESKGDFLIEENFSTDPK